MLRADHRCASAQKIHQPKWMLLLGAALVIVFSTLPLNALAETFPGKGSREKWNEAAKISLLGIEQANKSDLQSAQASFEKAISIYDQDPVFYFNLGYIHKRMNQFDKAEYFYKKALSMDPVYGNAWISLGWLYNAQGKTEDSLDAYKKASKCNLSPKDKKAVDICLPWLRGKNFYKRGKYNEALVELDKSIGLDSKNGEAYYLRGKVYEKLGKTSEAESDFARSKELNYKPKQGE